MRVPIPVVMLLCASVIGGVWWAGTRKKDFMTPPQSARLAVIRENTDDIIPLVDAAPGVDLPEDESGVAAPEPAADEPAMDITLHAGTGKGNAGKLMPVLEEISRDLEKASAGILKISSSVKAGNDAPGEISAAPIALWISGPDAETASTEVLVFTSSPDAPLRDQFMKRLLQLIRSYLARTAGIQVPETGDPDEDPLKAIRSHITGPGWRELGSRLNKRLE